MLRAADKGLTYVGAGVSIFKLFNRTILAEVLLADGQDAEAHGLLTKVRGVNPVMVAEFEGLRPQEQSVSIGVNSRRWIVQIVPTFGRFETLSPEMR